MAFKSSKKTQTGKTTLKTADSATFRIVGTVTDVYEGSKFNYATVRVNTENLNPRTNEPYYNELKVRCPLDMTLPDVVTPVEMVGNITTYFDRDAQRMITHLTVTSIGF